MQNKDEWNESTLGKYSWMAKKSRKNRKDEIECKKKRNTCDDKSCLPDHAYASSFQR